MTIRRPVVLINGQLKILPTGDTLPSINIGARIRRDSNQAIPNNTTTPISFNSARFDTDSIWTSSFSGRLTCKTAGTYLIGGCARFEANSTGNRFLSILFNGVFQVAVGEVSGVSTIANASCIYSLAVNDYVQLAAYQNSGVSLNVLYEPSFTPEFWMQLLP